MIFKIYCIAQFEDFDSPRPRLVRCVSVTTTGALDVDVGGAETEAKVEVEGGTKADASAVVDDCRKSSGTIERPE